MDRLPDELESVARIRHRFAGANEIKPRRRINWPAGITGTDDATDEEVDLAFDLPNVSGLSEYISDTTGAMFTGNTETGIAATYQDSDNTIDLVVGVDGTSTSINGSNQVQRAALTGDVTASAGSAATTIANDAVTTAKILNDNVTYAKIQNVSATDRLLGRDSASAGDIEEIAVGGGIEFDGAFTLRTSAFTGDVTKAAGSTVTAIGSGVIVSADFNSEAATSWTPAVSGTGWSGGSPGATYIKHGRLVYFQGEIVNPTPGTGALSITGLPFASAVTRWVGFAFFYDNSLLAEYPGYCKVTASSTTLTLAYGTGPITSIDSTHPFTWNAADVDAIQFQGTYIASS